MHLGRRSALATRPRAIRLLDPGQGHGVKITGGALEKCTRRFRDHSGRIRGGVNAIRVATIDTTAIVCGTWHLGLWAACNYPVITVRKRHRCFSL